MQEQCETTSYTDGNKIKHCCQARLIQSYSPGSPMCTTVLIHGSLGPPKSTSQLESWSVQPILQGSRSWSTHSHTHRQTTLCRETSVAITASGTGAGNAGKNTVKSVKVTRYSRTQQASPLQEFACHTGSRRVLPATRRGDIATFFPAN